MKMVDFDVAEVEYNMNKHKDIDIYSISYNKLVEKLRRPQKYVLLEAFNEIYSLEIQDVTDTAFFLKLTDDAIKHYTRVEKKIMGENEELKQENEEFKQFKENVINWVDSQMKFNAKKYIETEDDHFKSENIDLHNFKVFIGIDSDD